MINEFKTIQELKKILENRNMEIDDISILEKNNYSQIIYKFAPYFKNKNIENSVSYKLGTKISYIKNFYILNMELSSFLYKSMYLFENKFRSAVSWVLSKDIGWEYLNKESYKQDEDNELSRFLVNIKEIHSILIKKERVDTSKLKNGVIPLWIFVNELTFGQLSMLAKLSFKSSNIYRKLNISSRNKWKITAVNEYRNIVMHMQPLQSKYNKYNLRDVLTFLMSQDKKLKMKVMDLFNKYNFEEKLNSTWEEYEDYFNIKGLISIKKTG